MATDERHAGGETERTYAVQLVAGEAEPRDLTAGLTEFLAAVDFAFEWLQREDPQRDGTDRLSIIETRDGGRHEVWSYPPSEEPSAGQELVEVYGFNPVSWQPPSPPAQVPRVAPPAPPPALDPAPSEPTVPEPEPAPPPRHVAGRAAIVAWWRAAWDDKASRCCLIVAAVALWLTVGLADPVFLAALGVALAGLWMLRDRRRAPAPDPDDWL
jgi:hypothetical protein